MNRNVNYLYKRSGLLTELFHFIYVLGLRGVPTNPSNSPSYGPDTGTKTIGLVSWVTGSLHIFSMAKFITTCSPIMKDLDLNAL